MTTIFLELSDHTSYILYPCNLIFLLCLHIKQMILVDPSRLPFVIRCNDNVITILTMYGKCSKISNTLKLRTLKIIAENNFRNILKNRTLTFLKSEFLKLRTQVIFGGKSMSVYAQFTYIVERHLEGSILLKWVGSLARDVLICMPAQDYTFCLLIVRYMLSDKIKSKSALKAQTFLHERDKK